LERTPKPRRKRPWNWSVHSEIKYIFPSVSIAWPRRRLAARSLNATFKSGSSRASSAATRFSSWPGCVALRWYRTPGAIKPYGGH
jgi:hypothetical protein